MNVLHLSTALSWRGGEQQIAYLVDELKKHNINQWVVCSENSAMQNYCSNNNISFLTFKKNFFSSLLNAYKLKRICRQLNIGFVHLHDAHAHAAAVLSAAIFGNKTSFILSRRVDFPIKNNWFSKYKYNHPNIKKIICVSDAIKRILAADIKNKSLLTVVYDGVDINRFNTSSKKILRKTFSVANDELIIGNVAAIAPHKDYFTFADTVEILVQQKLKAKFFIIGDGPERKKIEQYIADKKLQQHIFLTGFRKDIEDIFSELDILLFTSKTEGLGSSVLDAYSCKVPVVATNAGGISEIVINEKTGLLSPVKDAAHLAKNVLLLIHDEQLRKELIKNGSEFLKRFTKEEMGKQTFQVYKEAAATKVA